MEPGKRGEIPFIPGMDFTLRRVESPYLATKNYIRMLKNYDGFHFPYFPKSDNFVELL